MVLLIPILPHQQLVFTESLPPRASAQGHMEQNSTLDSNPTALATSPKWKLHRASIQPAKASFMGLPAELRQQIYRYLLTAPYVCRRVPNPAFYSSKTESEPLSPALKDILPLRNDEIGCIQCQNPWIGTNTFEIAVLRVNQLVHQESWDIFLRESIYFTIHINKSGYGRSLRDHGFDVVHCGDFDRDIGVALDIRVVIRGFDLGNEESDTFIMTMTGLSQLPRAL